MKSTFKSRWGRERARHHHKNTNSAATSRRMVALESLKKQLGTGMKQAKGTFMAIDRIPLTDTDRKRIQKEITSLNSRI